MDFGRGESVMNAEASDLIQVKARGQGRSRIQA